MGRSNKRKSSEPSRMESITCHLKDNIEVVVNGEKRVEEVDITFDLPVPLLDQYREYPVNDFTEFDELIDEYIQFCHDEGFAEEDMTYLTRIYCVAAVAACCFLPNFRPKERQSRSFASWACTTWLHDDHCDGEDTISLEKTFRDRKIFEDMCKGKRPHPTDYKSLDEGRAKAIYHLSMQHYNNTSTLVPYHDIVRLPFEKACDLSWSAEYWICIEGLMGGGWAVGSPMESVIWRRVHSSGLEPVIELTFMLNGVIPSKEFRSSALSKRLVELVVKVVMYANDLTSIKREVNCTKGQNVVCHKFHQGICLHDAIRDVVRLYKEAVYEINRIVALCYMDGETTNDKLIESLLDVAVGGVFIHLLAPRYKDGMTYHVNGGPHKRRFNSKYMKCTTDFLMD